MRQALLFAEPEPERPVRPRLAVPPTGMRIVVLGSGSSGNAVVVESPHGRLLVDAGFTCRELTARLAAVGLAPGDLGAIVVTHEHGDHVRGISVFARRHRLPVYATAGTIAGMPRLNRLGGLLRPVAGDRPFVAAGFSVEPFAIPHDAREPVGFVVEDPAGCRFGLAADLGCASRLAWARLAGVHVLALETNHDLDMLRNGPYPWPLKQRVAGRRGHLSNAEAVEGLPELLHDGLGHVVAYHLSRTNNLPPLVAALLAETLEREGSRAGITVSGQFEPTPWIEVNP